MVENVASRLTIDPVFVLEIIVELRTAYKYAGLTESLLLRPFSTITG